MANGTRMILNTRERAVSDDNNRSWAFLLAQAVLAMSEDLTDNPDASLPSSVDHMTNSLVLQGLLVRPDAGTHVTIDAGAALFYDPAFTTADEGPIVLAQSEGVTSGALAFVANAGPDIRVDVFECRPVDILVAAESRDIYNPVTRLFVPTTVDKVRTVGLEFRVRRGAPSLVDDPEWLPLAVAFVKLFDLSYERCDFYDVRPLVTERRHVGSRTSGTSLTVSRLDFDGAVARLQGDLEGTAYGFKAGGDANTAPIRRSAPVSLDAYFNSTASPTGGNTAYVAWTPDNVADGFAPADGAMVGLYCVFPALSATPLPRWRRYSQGASPRVPTGPRGIFVFDHIARGNSTYRGVNVVLPTHLVGTLASPAQGIVAGCGWFDSGSTALHAVSSGGGWISRPHFDITNLPTLPSVAASAINATHPNISVTYNSTAGLANISYPPWSKGIRVMMRFQMIASEASAPSIALWQAVDITHGVDRPNLLGLKTENHPSVDTVNLAVYMGPFDLPQNPVGMAKTVMVTDLPLQVTTVDRTPSANLALSVLWVTAFKAW